MRKISYDVEIRLPVKGLEDKWVAIADLGNITWNVKRLILESSGWNIKNNDNNCGVLPWIQMIEHGIEELVNCPERYKQYESPNGWGTVSGTLRFYKECLHTAQTWITDNEDLLPVAVIWVS